jgi:hypothetical protein
MSYETPVAQEIGNADALTLGGGPTDDVDAEGLHKAIDNQF